MFLNELTKQELIKLMTAYDEYIYNDGDEWTKDRQPICLSEFYENEYNEF